MKGTFATLAIAAAGLLGVGFSSSAAVETQRGAPDVTIDAATAFRESMGLASDWDFVRASIADPIAFPDLSWGVPLTQGETDDLAARLEAQTALRPTFAQASTIQGYAGIYMDQHRGGRAVFLVAGGVRSFKAMIERTLPSNVTVDYLAVGQSLEELLEFKESIVLDWNRLSDEENYIVSVGIDEKNNEVEVGVVGSVEVMKERLPADVRVYETTVPVNDACTVENCPNAKGGIAIFNNNFCTTGFIAWRDDGDYPVAMTAGHCFKYKTASDTTWEHDSQALGTQDGYMYTGQDETNWPAPLTSDWGILKLSGALMPADFNRLVYRNASSGNITDITSRAPLLTDHPIDTPVCRIGYGSYLDPDFHARKCGQIHANYQTNLSCKNPGGLGNNGHLECARIANTVRVNFDSTGGDSGGAIWYGNANTNGPMELMGMHVHSLIDSAQGDDDPDGRGWYTPWTQIRAGTLEKNADIRTCLDDDC